MRGRRDDPPGRAFSRGGKLGATYAETHFRGAKGDYGVGWLVIPGIIVTFRNSTTP